jgi:hypothetical protein
MQLLTEMRVGGRTWSWRKGARRQQTGQYQQQLQRDGGLRNFPENQPVLLTKFLNLKTAENFLTGKSAGFADLSTVVVTRWKMI